MKGRWSFKSLDDGAFRFVRPSGQAFESPAPTSTGWAELVATHESADIRITPSTAVTRWTGEALDLDLAVETLMQRREKNVSAETQAFPASGVS